MSYRLVSAKGDTITTGPLVAMQFASCDHPGSFVLREVRRRAIEMASDEMTQNDGMLRR